MTSHYCDLRNGNLSLVTGAPYCGTTKLYPESGAGSFPYVQVVGEDTRNVIIIDWKGALRLDLNGISIMSEGPALQVNGGTELILNISAAGHLNLFSSVSSAAIGCSESATIDFLHQGDALSMEIQGKDYGIEGACDALRFSRGHFKIVGSRGGISGGVSFVRLDTASYDFEGTVGIGNGVKDVSIPDDADVSIQAHSQLLFDVAQSLSIPSSARVRIEMVSPGDDLQFLEGDLVGDPGDVKVYYRNRTKPEMAPFSSLHVGEVIPRFRGLLTMSEANPDPGGLAASLSIDLDSYTFRSFLVAVPEDGDYQLSIVLPNGTTGDLCLDNGVETVRTAEIDGTEAYYARMDWCPPAQKRSLNEAIVAVSVVVVAVAVAIVIVVLVRVVKCRRGQDAKAPLIEDGSTAKSAESSAGGVC